MKPSLYTKEIEQKICKLIATGKYSIPDICVAVDISPATYHNWQKANPEFKAAIKEAKESRQLSLNQMALSGLAKLLDTHTVDEEQTEYVSDENGKPVVRSKKVTKKTFMPNPAAVIFTLKNTDPEHWSDKQQVEHSGSISASPLEKMTREQIAAEKLRLEDILKSDSELD